MFEVLGLIGFVCAIVICCSALNFSIKDYLYYGREFTNDHYVREAKEGVATFGGMVLVFLISLVLLFIDGLIALKVVFSLLVALLVIGGIIALVDELRDTSYVHSFVDTRKEKIFYAVRVTLFVFAIVGSVCGIIGMFL